MLKNILLTICLLAVVLHGKSQSASHPTGTEGITVGSPAPAFTQVDKDGKQISLSDFKGKYVILDFWGSWCAPCRKSHPHLVELYQQYKGRHFEIIGLAGNDKREAWLKAIKDDGLLWPQINLAENKEKQDVAKLYGIRAYPTKILLDPNGVILVLCTGDCKDIDTKLKAIFGK